MVASSGRHRRRRHSGGVDARALGWALAVGTLCALLQRRPAVDAVICIKDYQSPFRGAPRGYAITLDCGRYVDHCVKIVTRGGQVIKDCDRVTLCPKDGSKMVHDAFYYCCRGNLCNSAAASERRLMSAHPMLAAVAVALLALAVGGQRYVRWWPAEPSDAGG